MTKQQKKLFDFIQSRLSETGVCPSFDEMKDALDLKSKSGIHRIISGLEERGLVARLHHRARSVFIVDPDKSRTDMQRLIPETIQLCNSIEASKRLIPGFLAVRAGNLLKLATKV